MGLFNGGEQNQLKSELEVKQLKELLRDALPYVEECQPPETHPGFCGPESCCDADCMAMAHWSSLVGRIRRAIS